MLFNFQLDASYLINESLNNNKIFILTGNRGVGKKYIINNMECDYNKYPIIENAYTINEFFSQLIIFTDNLSIADISVGVGQNLQLSFSLTQIMYKFSSFLNLIFKKQKIKLLKSSKIFQRKTNCCFQYNCIKTHLKIWLTLYVII